MQIFSFYTKEKNWLCSPHKPNIQQQISKTKKLSPPPSHSLKKPLNFLA
jgi:hypothetical protein